MRDQATIRNPVPSDLWLKTALWWFSGVITAVLLMTLLPLVGVYEPIAAGIGFGALSAVFLRGHTRFTRARYGVEFLPFEAGLWTLLGCVSAIGIVHAIGLMA